MIKRENFQIKTRLLYGINEFLASVIVHNSQDLVKEEMIKNMDIEAFLWMMMQIFAAKAQDQEVQLIRGNKSCEKIDYDKMTLDTAFIIYINLTILKERDPQNDKFERFAIKKLITTEMVKKMLQKKRYKLKKN